MLNERLNLFGIVGCILCIVGSVTIVLHAPQERQVHSLLEVWFLAQKPGVLSTCGLHLAPPGGLLGSTAVNGADMAILPHCRRFSAVCACCHGRNSLSDILYSA